MVYNRISGIAYQTWDYFEIILSHVFEYIVVGVASN